MAQKFTTIRWKLGTAAKEFGIAPTTLSARIKARGIEPRKDDTFSTLQICDAVYGDLEGEKILKTREERIKLHRENLIGERLVLPTDAMMRAWSSVLLEYRQRVLYAEIPQAVKEDLLATLTETKLDEYFTTSNQESEDAADDGAGAA